MSYRALAGSAMPLSRWLAGERPVADGARLSWARGARHADDHASFRRFLDAVFMFANTGSLAKQAREIAQHDLRPGDFVVQPGAPGHAVIVLDLARATDGRRVALIAQGFMPAQSLQVLRPGRGSAWFPVDEAGLSTPFWPRFSWSTLRRLD
jgi:hypothetical protein